MNFKGRVVIVTGAGSGIGRAIAMMYASEGANVVIAESDPVTGKETEEHILSKAWVAVFFRTDVRVPEDIINLISFTKKHYGRIDILINNAGISKWTSPYESSVEAWDNIINTNLRSVFLCSREAGMIMREAGGGSIVNIASTRAFMSEPNSEAYAASKGGIVALTHALSASFSEDHIQVNCISPGWIETKDYNALKGSDHAQHFSGRVGKPEDIARACLYLTVEGNDFISGTNLIIDGGMTRKMIYEE